MNDYDFLNPAHFLPCTQTNSASPDKRRAVCKIGYDRKYYTGITLFSVKMRLGFGDSKITLKIKVSKVSPWILRKIVERYQK